MLQQIIEISGLILGSALILVISWFFRIIKNKIMEFFEDIIAKKHGKHFLFNSLKNSAEVDVNIKILLARLMTLTSADRSYLFRFHNGTQDILGIPYRKCSCSHEVVLEGVSTQKQELQNLDLSDFPELIRDLCLNDGELVVCVDKINDIFIKSFFKKQGIECSLMKILKTKNNIVYGFIGIDYLEKPCKNSGNCKLQDQKKQMNDMLCLIEIEILKKKL